MCCDLKMLNQLKGGILVGMEKEVNDNAVALSSTLVEKQLAAFAAHDTKPHGCSKMQTWIRQKQVISESTNTSRDWCRHTHDKKILLHSANSFLAIDHHHEHHG